MGVHIELLNSLLLNNLMDSRELANFKAAFILSMFFHTVPCSLTSAFSVSRTISIIAFVIFLELNISG